jgi:surface polysaccharide O-acyltransferase-like enzyme
LVTETRAGRIDYIDLFKGIACLVIMYAHATAPSLDRFTLAEKAVFTAIFFAAPMFFFASGINVVTFLSKYGERKNFRVATFYLVSALLLFVLSECYSVNRGSLKMPQIFQGIAMGIAFTFVVVRLRLPNWLMMALALVLYAPWFLFWTAQIPSLEAIRPLPFAAEPAATFTGWIDNINPLTRVLMVHFSFLPWASYVLAGAATFRSVRANPATRPAWAVFFIAMTIIGPLTLLVPQWRQPLMLDSFADMLLRCYPFSFFLWMGETGLLFLAADTWYRGAAEARHATTRRALGFVEYLGRESFLFLVWHWAFLSILLIVGHVIQKTPVLGRIHAIHYLPWIVCTLLVVLTIRWAADLGAKWRRRPRFVLEASLVLTLFTLPGLIAFFRRGFVPPGAALLSFPACLAFAYLYPVLRERLRNRLTTSP